MTEERGVTHRGERGLNTWLWREKLRRGRRKVYVKLARSVLTVFMCVS